MTNSNLIPVFSGQILSQPVQLANARDLHEFVESKQDYSDWIKNRISDYGFVENEDYIKVATKTGGRGRTKIEYHITLDMGKELGMVERNEKGRQIRKHFIEIEKRAKAQQQLALPEPEKKFMFEFTEHELQQLVWSWFALLRCTEMCRVLEPALRQIGSSYAATVRDLGREYAYSIRQSHHTLSRITEQFQADQITNWRVLRHLRNYDPKKIGFQLDIL